MYNYSYEEYMNNLLGYDMNTRNNMYMSKSIEEPYEYGSNFTYYEITNQELEKCYPDIYKIVYPMVCKACLYITEEITEGLVERITNEIYENVEQEECPEETRGTIVNISYSNIKNNRNLKYEPKTVKTQDNKEEKRQRNFLLNDLIKILVIRELLGTGKRPSRPFIPQFNNIPILPRTIF